MDEFENDLLNSPDFAAMREMLKRTSGGLGTGGPDEGDDDETATGGALGGMQTGAPNDMRSSGLASLSALRKQGDATYDQLARNLRSMYEQSAEVLRQRRYGPTKAEQLFAVSAALAQPTRYKGFAATMGNLTPVLAQLAEAKRTGNFERAKALSDLAQQNLTAAQSLELSRGKRDLGLAGLEAKYALAGQTGKTWDSARGRWMNKNTVEAVDVGTDASGAKVVKYTDGTYSRTDTNGTVTRYDAEGNPING